MRSRSLFIAAAVVVCMAAAPLSSQATTSTLGAIGQVTTTGWGCPSMTLGIDFERASPHFLLQVGYFPPQNPVLNIDCAGVYHSNQFTDLAVAAGTPCALPYEYQTKPDRMTVSGNKYTFTNTFTYCSGVVEYQTTVITVNASTVGFSSVYDRNTGTDFRATGTLTRIW